MYYIWILKLTLLDLPEELGRLYLRTNPLNERAPLSPPCPFAKCNTLKFCRTGVVDD